MPESLSGLALHALIEWRKARKAFFEADHGQPSTYEGRKPLFDRLANAECALMAIAKELP